MDTPVSKSSQTHTFVPVNLYLRGLDYKVRSDSTTIPPTPARVNVVRMRLEQIQELENLTSRIRRTVQAVRDADRHGSALPSADLMVSMVEDLRAATLRLYKDIQAAEERFQNVPVPEAESLEVPAEVAIVVAPKPSGTIYLSSTAEAIAMRTAGLAEDMR